MADSTAQFSNRAADYDRSRPRYPDNLIDFLERETGLTASSVIADIGSGTGIASEIFLKNGNRVYGIEPNKDMRETAEKVLRNYQNFVSIDGTAEKTGLKDKSVDMIIAAQSFHWFDRKKSIPEFKRILKDGCYTILMWNERKREGSPFFTAYEDLVKKYASDYENVRPWNIDESTFFDFFSSNGYSYKSFKNMQTLDYPGLISRAFSTSYLPSAGQPGNEEMLRELESIFTRFSEKGLVTFEYITRIYYGRL